MGVTHETDTLIWFWANLVNGEALEKGEKDTTKTFLAKLLWAFLNGQDVQQTPRWKRLADPTHVRILAATGIFRMSLIVDGIMELNSGMLYGSVQSISIDITYHCFQHKRTLNEIRKVL